jgi:periplasmic divalent cation tolerance protein
MNGPLPYLFVQVTARDADEAWTIARTIVERKLAAAAQVFPIRSCYWWQGELTEDNEYLIFMKTRAEAYEALEACVRELHSYQVPAIFALPIVAGSESYLHWIDAVVQGPERNTVH